MTSGASEGPVVGAGTGDEAERLRILLDLLRKWNRAINLVAPNSLPDAERRHVEDSAQLIDHCPETARLWLDIGSGGGFPGLVVAILAASRRPGLRVELVESDQRKCAFLQSAVQALGLTAKVTRARIESLPPRGADVISARALASLDKLCDYALPHLAPKGICLFLKGANLGEEVVQARKSYRFDLATYPSRSDDSGVIARVSELAHV